MLKRLLLLLALTLCLPACADLPDDSPDSAPAIEKSEQALIITGFPDAVITQGHVISNPSGVAWSSTQVVLNKTGGIVWGTQGYQACIACGFQLNTYSSAASCTVRAAGGWNCGAQVITCPTVDTQRNPDLYRMTSGGAYANWNPDGPTSWYVFGNTVSNVTQAAYGGAGNWRLECGYATQSSIALGHY